jgi:hypothetical protein
MDSFETLLEKGQYELIIKATNDLKEPEAIFYRIIAFASILKFKEALEVLTSNRNILEEANMKLCIQLHIDVLILLGEFDLAFEEFRYYKERPYVSQEVEELLKSLPKYIREKEKESYRKYNRSHYNDLYDREQQTITWYSDETAMPVANFLKIKRKPETFELEFSTQKHIKGYDRDFGNAYYILHDVYLVHHLDVRQSRHHAEARSDTAPPAGRHYDLRGHRRTRRARFRLEAELFLGQACRSHQGRLQGSDYRSRFHPSRDHG